MFVPDKHEQLSYVLFIIRKIQSHCHAKILIRILNINILVLIFYYQRRLITWVLMRQNNSEVDPFRALYLPNEKNLTFIMDNFDKMKPRIFADITRFSHRFVEAIGVLIDKCIQVSDQFNLGKCHDLIERILYTEDNQMIESMFKNHNSFKVILTSFSRKRQQDLLSCYWDPILPLPI